MALLQKSASGGWRGLQALAFAVERLQSNISSAISVKQEQGRKDFGTKSNFSLIENWQRLDRWYSVCAADRGRYSGSYAQFPSRLAYVRWYSTERDCSDDKTTSKAAGILETFGQAGWSRQEVFNVPNALSMLRLISGPFIAAWIVQGQWELALPVLAVSGATDWADGYVAKNFNQRSVLGSYLDPLADKTLMCSVIAALGYSEVLSPAMVALILGRDALLVVGAFAARAKSLGWRWPGAGEFFRLAPATVPAAASNPSTSAGAMLEGGQMHSQSGKQQQEKGGSLPTEAPAAPFVEPLYISKVNTCFQLGLAGACMARAWLGVPTEDVVWWVASGTAVTTVVSTGAYLQAYMAGRLLTAGKGTS